MILLFLLIVYSCAMATALVMFGASTWLTLFVLVLSPTLLMWYHERLHVATVPLLAIGAFSFSLLVGSVVYLNGVWYETSSTELRLLGLLPLEAFIAAFLHILFYVTAYEYFFDNKSNSESIRHQRAYIIGVLGVFAFSLAYLYLFSHILVSFAFAWIILGLLVLIGYGMMLLYTQRSTLLTRAMLFSAAMLPVSLAYEWVSLANNLRFFANTNEYVYVFTVFGQIVPLEELLFVLLVPVVVALFYELFFDDAA